MKLVFGIQTKMDDAMLLESEDSENSVVEVEIPKKPEPVVINIDDDEIVLNLSKQNTEPPLNLKQKDIIEIGSTINWPKPLRKTHQFEQLPYPDHWTSDMIKFYNDDWGEGQFIVKKIQEKMDKSASLWSVSNKDLLFMRKKIKTSNIKCWNCCQYGHDKAYCPEPPYTPKCHMCGIAGHLGDACPNSKCLNCGNPSQEYVTKCYKCREQLNCICSRCHLLGHSFINCSDHWRLYHWTTGNHQVKIPYKNIYKPLKDMWCCNCGKKGHIENECNFRRNYSGFSDTLPFVVSYQKAFNDKYYENKSKRMRSKNLEFHSKKKETVMRTRAVDKIMKKKTVEFKKKSKKSKKRKKNVKKELEIKNQKNQNFIIL